MAAMVGPITPTVGQPYKLQLPVDMDRIAIDNDSPYDCWVYFGNVQPTDLTNANNTWHRVARRNHTSVLPVEGFRGASARERSPNAFAAFGGTVWLLLVNPGGIAYTGTVSARSQLYVTPLLPGDPSPVHAALATATDLSSQPRVLIVPFGLAQWAAGNWDPGIASLDTIETLILSAANLATQVVAVYLYGASCMPDQGQTGQMAFSVEAQPADSGSNPLGASTSLFWGTLHASSTGDTGTGCGWQSPWPLMRIWDQRGPLPANTARILIQLKKQGGTNVKMNYAIAANIDSSNSTTAGEIGNAALWRGPGGGAPIF